ncbi:MULTISPECIES: TorF family putative porin [unclassified Thioalkalivibrio]|uniref:TorF family putative porin n=1 Tax=unclassified Thioalkalivibrio TaxID=2621013 RepID=UPI00039D3F32|nr:MULTISPECIES: TorF family putative porin [unclassified Thioalkalivibrio]
MKKFTRSALAAAVLTVGSTGGVAFTSTAAAELSVNIGAVSNYYFRGFSETDDGAAVQGGIDYEHASGFYVGTWVSNVDFGVDEGNEDQTSYEMDLYLGFADAFDNGFGYDVGYIYYAYPDARDDTGSLSADFGEIYGEVSFDTGVVGLYGGMAYVVHDSDDSALEDDDMYFYAGLDVPFMDVYSAGFLVGRTSFDDSNAENYTHYTASLTRDAGDWGEFSFNLEYVDETDEDLGAWVGWSKTF